MAASASKSSKSLAISHPIEGLDEPLAQIYTHIHPLVILGVFYFQFDSLVKKPLESLPRTAIAVALLQVLYVCLCIPGSNYASLHPNKGKAGPKKKAAASHSSHAEPGIGFRLVPAFLSLVLSVSLGAPVIAAALILFGAPITTHQLYTVLCGLHISLLAVLPLFYVHGVDQPKWMQIAALNAPVDEVFGASSGTLVGAWIGAIPIPLDWDREWQKWPITIITGAYIGYAIGKMLGGYVFRGSRIKML
ncbi:hypothetical protein AAFC00_000291 [Neodothiora populina]|uniref:Glycosylphosphatidylinositol anchor biosynthesis protein 11 n=1 Tax=Neodothiora populina TaxID=2781224 RepID=A0ABR3PCH3_9PEZI